MIAGRVDEEEQERAGAYQCKKKLPTVDECSPKFMANFRCKLQINDDNHTEQRGRSMSIDEKRTSTKGEE